MINDQGIQVFVFGSNDFKNVEVSSLHLPLQGIEKLKEIHKYGIRKIMILNLNDHNGLTLILAA